MNLLAEPVAGLAASPRSRGQRLTTTSVAQGERFAYWLDLICSLYVKLDCEPPREAEIFGHVEFSRIGNLDFTHLRSNATRIRRTPQQIRSETDDFCLVLIQREGRGVLCQDGRMGVMNPGDFVINDCTRPYELMFDDDHHDIYVLRLPRKVLANHVANFEDLSAITVASSGAAGQLLLAMVDTLRRDMASLHPSSALGVSEGITSIIGAGLRSLPEANQRKPSNLAAFHLARIRAFVDQNLRDPELSIGAVAAAVKLSPDHLCRLFRGEPVPLSRLIWQQRLEACRRDLADARLAERGISEIAYSWGFNDATHFSRSFRERHGVSPREWRAMHFAA